MRAIPFVDEFRAHLRVGIPQAGQNPGVPSKLLRCVGITVWSPCDGVLARETGDVLLFVLLYEFVCVEREENVPYNPAVYRLEDKALPGGKEDVRITPNSGNDSLVLDRLELRCSSKDALEGS